MTTEVEVTLRVASFVDYRASFKATEGQHVYALQVYSRGCRRRYYEVRCHDCAAKIDTRT
ncbi:hypothetical protein [Streptomyces sp. NPDC001927]